MRTGARPRSLGVRPVPLVAATDGANGQHCATRCLPPLSPAGERKRYGLPGYVYVRAATASAAPSR
jgi:hypothetical protein